MKSKINILSIILLITLIFTGCSAPGTTANNQKPEEQKKDIETQQPLKVDEKIGGILPRDFTPNKPMILVYSGGFENGGIINITDGIKGNKYEIKSINTGASHVSVYEAQQDGVKEIYKMGEVENMKKSYINETPNRNDIHIKAPIEKGTKWEDKNTTYEITDVGKSIVTPAGTFDTIEITETYKENGYVAKRYYAKEIGFVKSVEDMYASQLLKIIYDMKEVDNINNLFKIVTDYKGGK